MQICTHRRSELSLLSISYSRTFSFGGEDACIRLLNWWKRVGFLILAPCNSTKELIADQLPRKIDRIVFCPLSEDQKRAYTRLLSHSEIQIILTHDEPCPCGQTDDLGCVAESQARFQLHSEAGPC